MPLREISINVPRDGSPQQSLRKKATVEALATSLFSPRGRGSIVDAVSALIEARGGEERRPGASAGRREQGRVRLSRQEPRLALCVGARLAREPAAYVPYDPLMASGGRAGRASPRTSFASSSPRASTRPPRAPRAPTAAASPTSFSLPHRGYRRDCVRRAPFADASPPPPLSRAVVPFAGWEVDACGYANAPPTFLALPAPLRCAFR